MEAQSHYVKVTDDTIALLAEIVGDKNILTGDEGKDYSWDESPRAKPVLPEVVVKPSDADSVAKILKLANEKNIPVTPRGGGTGLSGGGVPIHGGIVLSLERMNRILEIDERNFMAVVEPGVTLSSLNQALDERGLYYPLYPGELSATIGGTVSTNAGGMRALKYGVTRHFVLGLKAVLPTGEIVETGGKFVKSSTGYDLTQLITGSEGTLAVITEITLRLMTPPGRRVMLLVPFNSLHDAIRCVPDILKEKILPVGIEFMEKDIISMVEQFTGKEIPSHDYAAFLMIIVEADNEDETLHIANHIGEICLNHEAVDVFIASSEIDRKNLLEAREKFYPAIQHSGMLDIADVVVPRSQIAEFVEKTKEIGREHGIQIVTYGHAGDGNVHLHPVGQGIDGDDDKLKALLAEIYKVGISLGGTISGEHGLGFAKKDYLHMAADKSKMELMKRIKRAFDPNNIMNPGKVLDME